MASRTGAAPRVLPRDHRLIPQVWRISLNPLSVLVSCVPCVSTRYSVQGPRRVPRIARHASGVEARVHHSAL